MNASLILDFYDPTDTAHRPGPWFPTVAPQQQYTLYSRSLYSFAAAQTHVSYAESKIDDPAPTPCHDSVIFREILQHFEVCTLLWKNGSQPNPVTIQSGKRSFFLFFLTPHTQVLYSISPASIFTLISLD
jgi:hypothetical protein